MSREKPIQRYTTRVLRKELSINTIGIFFDDEFIGKYKTNHDQHNVFTPFCQDGQWYALYTEMYYRRRVMSLPDCVDVAVDENTTFYATDMYVPCLENGDFILMAPDYLEYTERDNNVKKYSGTFGFMGGCVWGGNYQILYVDLSELKSGKVQTLDRYGYVGLADRQDLKECVEISDVKGVPYYVEFITTRSFDFWSGEEDEIGGGIID